MRKQGMLSVLVLCVAALAAAGCSTSGMFSASNVTDVQLQRNNFRIIAQNLTGEASAGYVLGGTMSLGMTTSTLALVRVSGTGMLYKEALEDLWKNYEAAHGKIGTKKIALINVRYDADVLNLLVYTQPKIMVRADVVEFTD